MKIVFNSRLSEAPCTVFYHDAFRRLKDISVYDYDNWTDYDVALFMTYRVDLEDLKKTKKKYPNLITAIIDPRGAWVDEYLQYADFLIVDSIEMRDYWSHAALPIFEYAEYPDLKPFQRDFQEHKDIIIIGYHGNVIHLESMHLTIVPALEKLSRLYEIELWTMYNVEAHGVWKRGVPDFKVRHIPWSMENYYKYMAYTDIGIVPCFIPTRNWHKFGGFPLLNRFNRFNKVADDYLLRFKMPSNPGRIIVWGLLNVPVISDFFPSAMQCIDDGKSGLLAYSEGGWFRALQRFVQNPSLRTLCADNLTKFVNSRYSFSIQNQKFLDFLQSRFRSGRNPDKIL